MLKVFGLAVAVEKRALEQIICLAECVCEGAEESVEVEWKGEGEVERKVEVEK